MTKELIYKLFIYALTLICVGPFAYVVAEGPGIAIILIFTYAIVFHQKYKASTVLAFISITFCFLLSIVIWIVNTIKMVVWDQIELEFSIIFVIIFGISSLGSEIINKKYHKYLKHCALIKTASISLILSIIISLLRFILKIDLFIDSPYIIGILYGVTLGVFTGIIANRIMLPAVKLFSHIEVYIKVLALPMTSFFCGYIIIILSFAGIYTFLARTDPTAFSGPYTPSLTEFITYSILDITTLGVSNIIANNDITKWLSALEVFFGVVWTTVVLAATIGYVQKGLDDKLKKIKKSTITNKI